jgi:hypothetical protein
VVTFDPEAFDRECHLRGLTGTEVARLARLRPATITALRHRRVGRPSTLRKLAVALALAPTLPNTAGRLMTTKDPTASTSVGSQEIGNRALHAAAVPPTG